MIQASELRLGNYILHKAGVRILPVRCTFSHLEILGQSDKDIFPVKLKADILEKCGFAENKKYALLPQAHEYILPLPVMGNQQNEIRAYIKTNQECFARASMNNIPLSNNIFHLHQLQNLYHALTGQELNVVL
ncbi:MAG: hypothetical protein ACO1OO_12170 [Flavisolibacter sp.]